MQVRSYIYNVRRRRRFCRCLFRIGSDGILIKPGLIGHLVHYMYVCIHSATLDVDGSSA